MHLFLLNKSVDQCCTGITQNIQIRTFLLKTEKAWPQALHTRPGLPELVGGYVEYPALGANLKGPAPAPNPGCWPLTAPVPMTSFSRPQHEAHMDEAPAWQSQNSFNSVFTISTFILMLLAILKNMLMNECVCITMIYANGYHRNKPYCMYRGNIWLRIIDEMTKRHNKAQTVQTGGGSS